jgi:acetyltransferase-like isoleucine patch superfamily enzyme
VGLAEVIRTRHKLHWFKHGDAAVVGARTYYLDEITILYGHRLGLGNGVGFGTGCWINASGGVFIGMNTMIGPRCLIHSANHKIERGRWRKDKWVFKPTYIGDDVWIGANVTILPGADIGDGCIVGAGSVLSGRYPRHMVIYPEKARARRRA